MAWSLISIDVRDQEGRPGWKDVRLTVANGSHERSVMYQFNHNPTQAERDAIRDALLTRLDNYQPDTSKREMLIALRDIFQNGAQTKAQQRDSAVAYLLTVVGED